MIRQNDFTRQWKSVGPAFLAAVERVGSSGCYVLGKEVVRFERTLAEFLGINHAVGVGKGVDALEMALRCQKAKVESAIHYPSVIPTKRPCGSGHLHECGRTCKCTETGRFAALIAGTSILRR